LLNVQMPGWSDVKFSQKLRENLSKCNFQNQPLLH
jgi:hypothetical protein